MKFLNNVIRASGSSGGSGKAKDRIWQSADHVYDRGMRPRPQVPAKHGRSSQHQSMSASYL